MASSSKLKLKSKTESNSTDGWTYDVFLSFAGADTRKGFIGHLYRALDDRGIYTFKDDLRLRMGDSISEEILKSIEESRISVVVFSGKYANSSWCLDELVKIMECRKEIGQTVIPVFYNIKPSDVEKQEGALTNAFRKHEEKYKNDLKRVCKWKDALSESSGCTGCDIPLTANGNEADCIIKIVQEISSICRKNSSVAKDLVGIIPRVREVRLLLDTTPDDVRIIGIWGMGGAGKTTLAWAVYNEISNQFQGRSYVANIREVSKTSGLHILQRQVLSELLSEPNMMVENDLQGGKLMASRLCRKKILLVLDDVDDDGQLDALAGSRDWFGMGSRIIITTRDKHCLQKAKVDKIYTSTMLDDAEAIKLFSLIAFERSSPPEEFKEHVHQFVAYAAGLPLALKVLGSFLYGRGITEWKSALERIKVAPEDKINEILKISFDGLRETEQKIFLDIACFFKGWKRNRVTDILDSFDFFPGIGISVLIQKSLISVSRGVLCMHDRIQEMGWHIVRKVSKKPGEHSRLWLTKDVLHVLTSKTGTDAVEGICLDLSWREKNIMFSSNTFESMDKLRLLYIKRGEIPQVHMLPNKSKWFCEGICNLFSKGTHYSPSNLQWLHWEYYDSDTLPELFLAEELVGLEMPESYIIQLWKGRKNLDKLRFINLHYSRKLRSIPDLTGAPNLKSLILDECESLFEVHPLVGDLKQLVYFSSSCCPQLRSLPPRLQMESLETLIVSSCQNVTKFPEIAENMRRLLKLDFSGTGIDELPKSIANLTGLVFMSLRWCRNLTSLPGTICSLKCLKTLNLSYCSGLEKLPKNMGEIQSLEELFLDETPIREPPSSFKFLKNLKTLSLRRSKELMHQLLFSSNSDPPLLLSFGFVKRLIASDCSLSEDDFPGDLSSLLSLEELDLSYNNFKYLPYSISQLPQLKLLDVSYCHNLEAIEELPSTIAILKANCCRRLACYVDITNYESLWNLCLVYDGQVLKNIELALQALLQGHLFANHRFSVLASGDTIPQWFSGYQQNQGNDICLELPLNWCNGDILGFAICAAFGKDAGKLHVDIQFDMMEETMQDFEIPRPSAFSIKGLGSKHDMWLGFMSIDFFKMLFPDLKEDNWTEFKGKLLMSGSNWAFRSCEMCAIRPVYRDDLEGGATIKNSAGLLHNSTGRPQLKYVQVDDGGRPNVFGIEESSLSPIYFERKGRMSTEVRFDVLD